MLLSHQTSGLSSSVPILFTLLFHNLTPQVIRELVLKKKRLSRIWKGSLERSSICFYLHFESSYVNPSVVSSQLIQREQIATFYLIPSKKTCWSVRSCHCRTIVNFVRLNLLLLQERSLHLDIHNSRIALTRQDEEISIDGHSDPLINP